MDHEIFDMLYEVCKAYKHTRIGKNATQLMTLAPMCLTFSSFNLFVLFFLGREVKRVVGTKFFVEVIM